MPFARTSRFFRTLGARLTLWNLLISILGTITVFTLAYLLVRRVFDTQANDLIDFRLSQFAGEYSSGGHAAVVRLSKVRVGRAQRAFFVRLADRQNRTVFLRDADDWTEFAPESLAGRPVPESVEWTHLEGLDGTKLRIASRRLSDGNLLQVGKTLENHRELLRRFRNSLLGIATVVFVVSIPVGVFVASRALRPVQRLTATVRSILETGKFTARVPVSGSGDEIDELVIQFNTMLGKIETLIRGMHESLENVAHDLRTPMTHLRNTASRAIESGADKEASYEALADCLEESERVVAMLRMLMDIGEAEAGAMNLHRQSVAVAALAGQVSKVFEHIAEEKGIAIRIEVPPELEIRADPIQLQRALANLMDNAFKYTADGGRVWIRAASAGDRMEIEVGDSGEGIAPEEQARIWERLYRVDKSRSRRGRGLGLSFVKAIVEAHGGDVSLVSEPGRGSRFTVSFPAQG